MALNVGQHMESVIYVDTLDYSDYLTDRVRY